MRNAIPTTFPPSPLDQLRGSGGSAACREKVVHDEHALALP